MLTTELDKQNNILKFVTDSTVTLLDFEDVLDLLTDVQHYAELMEQREIEMDDERFADEYGYAERAWRE